MQDPSVLCLKQIFACHNHTSSVRALASHEQYLASGGADDRICLIDLKEKSEFNQLMGHDGTVNSLAFTPNGKYLFSCGSDGKIIATDTNTWTTHKTWPKAHKGSVEHISIHPKKSQLALTLGSDMILKTWNMVDGRQKFAVNVKNQEIYGGSIFLVEWSPNGENFALVGNKGVVVLSVETTMAVKTIKTEVKPTSFCWIDTEFLAVGLEDGHFIYSSIKSKVEDQIQMENSRIKAISSYNNYLATVTSAGDVSLWLLDNDTINQVCTTNIGCRPICLLIVDAAKYDMEYEVKEEEAVDGQKSLKIIQSVGTVVVENDDEEDQVMEEAQKDEGKKEEGHDKTVEVKDTEVLVEDTEVLDKEKEVMDKNEEPKIDEIKETPLKKDKKHRKKDKKMDFIEEDAVIAEIDDQIIMKSAKKSTKKKKNVFVEEDFNADDEEIQNTDKKSTKRKAKPTDFLEEDIDNVEEAHAESPVKKQKGPEKTPKKKKLARELDFLEQDDDDKLSKSMTEKPSKKAHKNKKHNKTLA